MCGQDLTQHCLSWLHVLLVLHWRQHPEQQQQQPAEGSKEAREARIGLRK
jgi:hypothetical protein